VFAQRSLQPELSRRCWHDCASDLLISSVIVGTSDSQSKHQKFNSQLCHFIHSFWPTRCILILPVNKQQHILMVLNCWYDCAIGNSRCVPLLYIYRAPAAILATCNLYMYKNNKNVANTNHLTLLRFNVSLCSVVYHSRQYTPCHSANACGLCQTDSIVREL